MDAKAFLFDLDGVLTNTARYHFLAWKQLCSRLGLNFYQEDNHRLLGVSRLRSLEIILELNGCASKYDEKQKALLADEKNKTYVSMIKKITPDDLLPGVSEFLMQARSINIRLAVASASRNARSVLERLQILDNFDYVADAANITHPKPHPEIFLDCSRALEINPLYCIGFEDAQAGIEAIHSAGMFSVGIGVSVTSVAPDLALNSTNQLSYKSLSNSYSLWLKQREAKKA